MRFLDQMDLKGKKTLVRVDFNVPMDNGMVTDDNRIQAALPTIQYILEQGGSVILCAHLGKPKGKPVPELSLGPVARQLCELIEKPVGMAPDSIGDKVRALVDGLQPGHILMLENLRFHPGETSKDEAERDAFAKELAQGMDVYVDDAFGVAHRVNASVCDVLRHIPECCAGFLLKKEWDYLGEALKNPERPFTTVSGGAKVSSKLGILNNLLGKVDHIIIGGAMANTFLLAQGNTVGKSLVEADMVDAAAEIMRTAEEKGTTLHLPVDFVLGDDPSNSEAAGVCAGDAVPDDKMILDIGPRSAEQFSDIIGKSKTVVWNGPMGLFEKEAFADGSIKVAEAVAGSGALTIMGGGETAAVAKLAEVADEITFISTGGGSFLEFLEGKELPAFKALKEYAK